MHAQIFRKNFPVDEIDIPIDWSYFWLYFAMGIVCLILSAYFAKVKIGSFPVNPFYWHYWVVVNSKVDAFFNESTPRIPRPHILFWVASIFLIALSFLLLFVIFFEWYSNA